MAYVWCVLISSIGVWNLPVFATAIVAAKAMTPNAVRTAFIVISILNRNLMSQWFMIQNQRRDSSGL